MISIINNSRDPYYNLALEEYVITEMPDGEDYFILWQNEPTIVVGRNQNTIEEINLAFVERRGIKVVRRMSGGGAVYHDHGNLNYTFVVQEEGRFHKFDVFTSYLIETLGKLGIQAENSGRNDITINGRKFSGNAQFKRGKRLLHHGTILFNSSLDVMVEALNVSPEKIISKGIKSVKSRVTNIKEHLSRPLDICEFKDLLYETVFAANSESSTYYLSDTDHKAISELRNSKYATWDWVFGSSPPFTIQKRGSFDWGNIDIRLSVNQGLITECKIYGDFFAAQDIEELEKIFVGLAYRRDIFDKNITSEIIRAYWPSADVGEIIQLLF
ncbi:lipoate-protein ligase a [hydrocarbon metagenome]|uniref:lipoate--protein ligase n=1 Tax=hydrocarbon metagenome TaxID=938273 RepID=A0A0W8E1Z9_9ZZZZ